nr:integrin-linked protein kinase family [Tanacetum cinerariifolium]
MEPVINEGCDTFSAVTLPDEDNTVPNSELPVALANSMDVYVPLKIQSSLDDQTMMVENAAAYSECTEKNSDIETGKAETPSTNGETLGDLKNDEEQMKSLQKQISFEMGGKCMQLLLSHSLILPKFSTRGPENEEIQAYRLI